MSAEKKVPCVCDCKSPLCGFSYPSELLCDYCYYGNWFNDYPHNAKGRRERKAIVQPQDSRQEGKA